MTNSKKALISAACAALTVVGASPVAQAATVGDTSVAASLNCSQQYIYMSDRQIPAGGGVITSWTLNRPTGGLISLKLLSTGFFTDKQVSGTSDLVNVPSGSHTMQTRIGVYGGENLALWLSGSTQECRASVGGENVTLSETSILTNPAVGSGFELNRAPGDTYEDGDPIVSVANNRLVVKVVVEPDVDDDLFGDQTQDNCPTAYGANSGCPAVYTPPPPPPPVCKVPSVKGLAKKAATSAIFAAGCKQSKTKTKKIKKFTKTKKKGHVASQTVKAGTVLPFGSTVGITVYAKKTSK